jgi:hypothetical protein
MKGGTMMKGIGWVYIREALEKAEVCFLCHLENRFEQRYVDNYLYELVMDAGAREKIIESRGFCNTHFYKILASSTNPASSDGLGMALILKSVTEQLFEDVTAYLRIGVESPQRSSFDLRGRFRSSSAPSYLRTVSNQENCPACDHVSEIMRIYITEFVQELKEDNEIKELFNKSRGLCIPHYVMTLHIICGLHSKKFPHTAKTIVDKQLQVLEGMQNDLSVYIERQDCRFSDKERAGTEKAVGESLAKVVGRRGTDRTLARIIGARKDKFP